MSHDIQTLERRGMSKLQLMPHQREAVEFGLKHGRMLLGADPGTGKTAVAAILATNWLWAGATKVLVVCPATLKLNWLREIEQWNEVSATRIPDLSIGIASGSYFPDDCHIVIINYDILHRHKQQVEETQWDVAILDESHAIRNRSSLRSKMVVGGVSMEKIKERGKPTKQKIKERFAGIKARYKLALSGTPILNKPVEIWTTLKWLDSEKWGNYKWFTERYCGAAPTGWGGSMDVSGCTNAKELHQRLKNLMFRVLKKDVLKDLPPKIQQIIPLPAPQNVQVTLDKQLKEWGLHEPVLHDLRRRREQAKLAHNQEEFERLGLELKQAQSASLAAMSTYRKELGISKIPLVVQHVEDALENGGKIIVFAHHLEVINTIAANLMKHKPVVIHGGTPNDKRQAAVDQFQTDPDTKIAVLSILAAGVGITLTASSHVVFAECDWRPGINSQALDRSHRHGQKESVLGQYLVYEGSLDAVIMRRCIEKQQMIDTVVDGRKEVTTVPVAVEPEIQRVSAEKLELVRMALKQVQDAGEASPAHVTEIHRFLTLEKLKPQHEARALELAQMYRGCLTPSLRLVLR